MLEVRNLNKIYKTKRGVKTHALRNVNLKFEEKGLVFILGKSGSGKSTLLNVMGGLDKYDSGEIIIKGKSSRDFKNTDFDSYRNTYVGFIFQEFYIIEDFSVEENIALALKLQHRKADKEIVDGILSEVDLAGFGQRKPNELSGGQKQRVAIARALIKNPQIIMADEPTGSLDSATGKQMFETLKKLSKNKLVLVVSHDRESAEKYGDRVIELSDGVVIRDIKRVETGVGTAFVQTDKYEHLVNSYLHIKDGTDLTAEEQQRILEIISRSPGEIFISLDSIESGKLHNEFKHDSSSQRNGKTQFVNTDSVQNDYKQYTPKDFRVIKSRLPFKEAFKMGASNLKRKRIRLALTILLSMVAFVFFGLSDTFASFSPARSLYDGLSKSGTSRVGIVALEPEDERQSFFGYKPLISFSDEKINEIERIYEGKVDKMYRYNYGNELLDAASAVSEDFYETRNYVFYYPLNSNYGQNQMGLTATDFSHFKASVFATQNSKVPTKANQVIITDYLAELFKDSKLAGTINNISEIVGKTFEISGATAEVSGIIKTGVMELQYESLKKRSDEMNSEDYILQSTFDGLVYSTETIYVREEFLDSIDLDVLRESDFSSIGKYFAYNETQIISTAKILDNEDYLIVYNTGKSKSTLSKKDYIKEISLITLCDINSSNLDGFIRSKLAENDITPQNTNWQNYKLAYQGLVKAQTITQFIEDQNIDLQSRLEDYMEANGSNEELILYDNYDASAQETLSFAGYALRNGDDWEEAFAQEILRCWYPNEVQWDISEPTTWSGWQIYDNHATFYLTPEYFNELASAIPLKPYQPVKLFAYLRNDFGKDMRLLNYITNADNHFSHETPLSFEIDSIKSILDILYQVFFYTSIVFCLFAALLLSSFISFSVSNKKKEIGILRALGSRQTDVFAVFLIEGILIAVIELVLSYAITIGLIWWLNSIIGEQLFTVLAALSGGLAANFNIFFFGLRQALLMLALALGVVFVASFIPVKKIASMKPIDAIKDK